MRRNAATTGTHTSIVQEHLHRSARTLDAVATACTPAIRQAADLLIRCFEQGNKLLLCGNGGSAADAQHMAAEFVSQLRRNRPRAALSALALTTDTSFLTAYANDVAFAGVFARQVEAHGKQGDVLLGITTSGKSENILRACAAAQERQMVTIGLTGTTGFGCPADCVIAVPSTDTQHVQEAHIAIEHILCELVEEHLFPACHGR